MEAVLEETLRQNMQLQQALRRQQSPHGETARAPQHAQTPPHDLALQPF